MQQILCNIIEIEKKSQILSMSSKSDNLKIKYLYIYILIICSVYAWIISKCNAECLILKRQNFPFKLYIDRNMKGRGICFWIEKVRILIGKS